MRKIFTAVLLTVLGAATVHAQLVVRCNWGIGPLAPAVWSGRNQVMMTPVVMDFTSPATGISQIAFTSFEGAPNVNGNKGGVLRVMDLNCREIAQFPPHAQTDPIPPSCPSNLFSHFLAPIDGIAAGNIDLMPGAEIVAVLDEPNTGNGRQLVAFNLSGNPSRLVPKWCSQNLPLGDFITAGSAPAIAQLDLPQPVLNRAEVVIDNKIYNFNGTLRYNGGSCAACSRSRASIITNFLGPANRPQVITGRGAYRSNPFNAINWTGTPWWTSGSVTNSALNYSAVANLDLTGPPEIVVVDTLAGQLRILNSSGVVITSQSLGTGCGGAPMIGNADGIPGPEIGVATCSAYKLFKYSSGTLTQVWTHATYDPSGQTTSAMINTPAGARIFYADATTLWDFNFATGNVQQIPNSSATGMESPVIASSFPNGGPAAVIVAANNYLTSSGPTGVRIFDDPTLGPARSYWNEPAYHATNVLTSGGAIPTLEQPNWLAANTYRVQQWP